MRFSGYRIRFSDFKIRSRIYIGFGVLVVIAGALAGFGFYTLSNIGGRLGQYEAIAGNMSRNLQVQYLAEQMRRDALSYSVSQGDSAVDEFDADQATAIDLLAGAAKATVSEKRRRFYTDASTTLAAAKTDFHKLVQLGETFSEARDQLFSGGDNLSKATSDLVEATRALDDPLVKTQTAAVDAAMLLVRVANWRFLTTRDPKGPASFKAAVDKANTVLDALQSNASAAGLKTQIAPVKTGLAAYAASFAEVSSALLQSDQLFTNSLTPEFNKVAQDSAAAQNTLASDFARAQESASATVSRTMALQGVLASMAIVLGMALAYFIGRGIANPVSGMTLAMKKLAGGDTSAEIPAQDSRNEIGDMAQAVAVFKHSMIEADRLAAERRAEQAQKEARQKAIEGHIAEFDRSVREALEALASAATEMRATATSMSATAEETQRQAGAVASASEDTSTNVQTVAASAEEMTSSISEIGRQVTQAAEIAKQAVEDAQRTNGTVTTLAEAAQKIGQVVQLIQDIASQTNLLALNATIEAARAGEAGKGFAVVASEVKSLANQTAKATEEIAAQIGQIQTVTGEAVTAIQGIGGTIGHINEISTAIASAVEEQGAATQEIARNTQQAAKGTEQVSSNIAGVNRAAGETGAAASQVLASAEQLGRQSEILRADVNSFLEKIRAA
jgi:methyl-accepting chemotaxis protein